VKTDPKQKFASDRPPTLLARVRHKPLSIHVEPQQLRDAPNNREALGAITEPGAQRLQSSVLIQPRQNPLGNYLLQPSVSLIPIKRSVEIEALSQVCKLAIAEEAFGPAANVTSVLRRAGLVAKITKVYADVEIELVAPLRLLDVEYLDKTIAIPMPGRTSFPKPFRFEHGREPRSEFGGESAN
jgi:hypothetical protein